MTPKLFKKTVVCVLFTLPFNSTAFVAVGAESPLAAIALLLMKKDYSIQVTVSGLEGGQLLLENNGGDNLQVTTNGSHIFATRLAAGQDYEVTMAARPTSPKHGCYVTNSTGTVANADITDIAVQCYNLTGQFVNPILKPDYTRSVAAGDLDGDGDIDFVQGNNSTPNAVWMNDGRGSFTDSGQTLGAAQTYDVALGDIDGDGDLDLVAANTDQASKLWLNDGSGVFTDSAQVLDSGWLSITLGDIDGDDDLDVVAGLAGGNQVWINTAGVLADSGQSLGSSSSYKIALGDVDGDNDLDMLVANYQGTQKIWLNNGTGVFSDSGQALGITNSYTQTLAVGDIDNDNDLDFISGEWGENIIWLNNGSGVFIEGSHFEELTNDITSSLLLGDIDDDGDLDLVEGYSSNGGQSNRVWLNDAGVFTLSGQTIAGNGYHPNQSYALALADLDGDADQDLLIGFYGGVSYPGIQQAMNNGNGILTVQGQNLVFSGQGRYVNFGDFDGDGDIDRFARLWLNDNDGGANFVLQSALSINCSGSHSLSLSLDVDADDDLDIVLDCLSVGRIFLNDGSGNFSLSTETLTQNPGGAIYVLRSADLDNDGDQDIVIGNSGSQNTVWRNNSNGTFAQMAETIPANYTTDIAFGDMDGDGNLDMVEAVNNASAGYRSVLYYGNGDGTFDTDPADIILLSDTVATSVAVGDIDGDNDLDIVFGGDDTINDANGLPVEIWVNNGLSGFVLDSSLPATNTYGVDLGDIDGDGDLDLLTASYIYSSPYSYDSGAPTRLYLNDGGGNFSLHLELGKHMAHLARFADLDGDGDLDIGTADYRGFDRVYFNQTQ